jgi:hypothetical protein
MPEHIRGVSDPVPVRESRHVEVRQWHDSDAA